MEAFEGCMQKCVYTILLRDLFVLGDICNFSTFPSREGQGARY